MRPTVTKSCRSLVGPHGKTPSGNLPLSPIDKLSYFRRKMDMVIVFMQGREPAKVIREALSKALDYYYPLAGRVVESEDGDLHVACTGEGAWFVEASANCSLKDVNLLELPLMIPEEDIIPYSRSGVDSEDAIVMIQVTEFTCGGFAFGYIFNHIVLDGIGNGQFLMAISEMARGLTQPTVLPVWLRESIPGLLQLPIQQLPSLPDNISNPFEYSMIDVSLDTIMKLKSQFEADTGGRTCTTFEVVGAKLWQCWTRVACDNPQLLVEFAFPMNVRPFLHQIGVIKFPDGKGSGGYYGNCIHGPSAKAPGGKISSGSTMDVVDLIRDAKERAPVEFWNWTRGELEISPGGNFLSLLDWRGLRHADVDYGWGPPARWGPLTVSLTQFFPWCIMGHPPVPMQGVRLYTRVVTKDKLAAFLHQMQISL